MTPHPFWMVELIGGCREAAAADDWRGRLRDMCGDGGGAPLRVRVGGVWLDRERALACLTKAKRR